MLKHILDDHSRELLSGDVALPVVAKHAVEELHAVNRE